MKWFFGHQNLISNWLIYLVHAKWTVELTSFGFSGLSVRSLVSAKRSANRWIQTINDFTFCLIFGLSPNLGLSESLSERLIQKVKWPVACLTRPTATVGFPGKALIFVMDILITSDVTYKRMMFHNHKDVTPVRNENETATRVFALTFYFQNLKLLPQPAAY